MVFSPKQQLALALAPKVSGFLSILGSGWIVVEVLTTKEKVHNVYNRLLLAMSVIDVLTASWFFASTWPIPAGTANVFQPLGSIQTCSAQGFFLQFAIANPICKLVLVLLAGNDVSSPCCARSQTRHFSCDGYGLIFPFFQCSADNTFLSVYYLLVVKYGVSEERLRFNVEPPMHLFALAFGIMTGVAGLYLTLYNNADLWCWIASYPGACKNSMIYGYSTCERGDNAYVYRYVRGEYFVSYCLTCKGTYLYHCLLAFI